MHPEHAKAELSALIRMNGTLTIIRHQLGLDVVTENPAIARRIYSLIKQVYHQEATLSVRRKMKLKKNNQYVVRLVQGVQPMLQDMDILAATGLTINTSISDAIMSEPQRMRSYLRGAFLAGGSVNNPETSSYHLEIYSLYEDHNADILTMMNHFHLNARAVQRRSGFIAYLKEAEKNCRFSQRYWCYECHVEV